MIDAPTRKTTQAQHAAAIHLEIPVAAMREEFPRAIAEITAALQEQSIAPAGPTFAHHFRRPTDSFDFSLCVPVSEAVAPSGRVQSVVVPALPVMHSRYHGDYAGLPHAWADFIAGIQTQEAVLRGDFIETYTVGPNDGVPPEQWRTDLSVILVAEGQEGK